MLEARAAELAACLRVREVRVQPERGDAALARVTLVRRDPFDDAAPLAWPDAGAQERSLWDPIPLGVDEHGESVQVGLVERNVLVGGEPGAGKSVALSLLVAAAALDPTARVWLLDGKLVELAAWAPVAERLVGPDGGEAIELLRDVQREMDARYRELLARGLRKVRRDDGLPLHLVVVDELAFYLTLPGSQAAPGAHRAAARSRRARPRGRRDRRLRRRRSRAPTSCRRRCATCSASGWRCAATRRRRRTRSSARAGRPPAADASTVPGAQRGVGLLLAEGEQPIRVKTFHLDDDELAAIAERASARRADAWLASGATTEREAVG